MKGLIYFYEECYFFVVYKGVKLINIFLDYNFYVKIVNFGFNVIYMLMGVFGMFGYVDFFYVFNVGFVCDIYSFGVVFF